MDTKRSGRRARGQTQISISLPEALLSEIDRLATKCGSNRSTWICAVALAQIHRQRKFELIALRDAAKERGDAQDAIDQLAEKWEAESALIAQKVTGIGSTSSRTEPYPTDTVVELYTREAAGA